MAARLFRTVMVCSRLAAPSRFSPVFTPRATPGFVANNFCLRMAGTSSSKAKEKREMVTINFIDRDGDLMTVNAKVGDSLLDVAKDNDVDLEGACEGTLSCSTCHLIFKPDEMSKLNLDEPSDEELDMLDLAYGLEETDAGCTGNKSLHYVPNADTVSQRLVTQSIPGETISALEAKTALDFRVNCGSRPVEYLTEGAVYKLRSRLGCQIIVTKDFKGITLRVPKAHRDIRDL